MVISIANQKGGAQKTTITTLFATAVHYGIANAKVAIIDVDLQHSLCDERRDELSSCKNDPYWINKFEKLHQGKELYPIISVIDPVGVCEKIEELKGSGYNFIFIDLPGTLEADGLELVYAKLNYIFVPVSSDRKSFNSSNQFIFKINKVFINNPNVEHSIKGMAVVFSKYINNPRYKMSDSFNSIREIYENGGVSVLNNGLPYSKLYESDVVSTIFPFPRTGAFKDIHPYAMIEEMLNFIKTINNQNDGK